ncbi:transcription regulator [Halovivax asiaticus JCM 14624]|uniref:Transcription regulator n=1 Tax=Halovivax asiaticus JCM 14624 TaxID=1227490 RepID=M0BW27_9EURY|nr:helix-turn-helix domain-containing protein [Halovivax asiaticus]ELZ14317.1 transcription regulator [Halovivax asiaticus JCM 14624]
MSGLLPTGGESTVTRSDDATVCFLDDDRADDVLAAVGSETAREICRRLCLETKTPSALATDLDRTVETVSYHLDHLVAADLVEPVDTVYSEKGREMTVYAAAADPTVLVFGSADNEAQLRAALGQLCSAVGPMAILIALKEVVTDGFDVLDWV